MYHQGTEHSIYEQRLFHQDHLANTKICQNNQAITLAANMANPTICPLCSAMQLVLTLVGGMPPAFYKTKEGKTFYLTDDKFAELLRAGHSKGMSRYYPG
jgi:hypothetical protein